MPSDTRYDYAMERRLRSMAPELHKRFTDAVFGLQRILTRYQLLFPDFTDHTELHSLTVIDFCNHLMGSQIEKLNPDELYALLLGIYFHDCGMGISRSDYEEFSAAINFGDYFETHDQNDLPETIRSFHNEFSGQFILKYADFFEIPSEAHLKAIVQISRGHRKTDLMDEREYPIAFPLPNGQTICLPYLSALIRLSDEIDVTAARNSPLLYDIASIHGVSFIEHKKHLAIRDMAITDDAFILMVDTKDDSLVESIREMIVKMQKTLDDCRRAVLGRTPYVITQERIELRRIGRDA